MGTGSMCIDVHNIFHSGTGFLDCPFHCGSSSHSVLCRRSDVVSITGGTISDYLCQNVCSSCLCVFQILQNNHTSALAHDKSITVFVKGNGATLRILTSGQSSQCCESSYTDGADTALGSACQHYVCITGLDASVSLTNRMRSGCTGSYYVKTLTFQAISDGNISCCHIGNHHGHHQRIHTIRSFFYQFGILFFHYLKTSDTGTDRASYTIWVFFAHIKSCLFHGLFCCCHCILGKRLHSLCCLKIHVFFCNKSFDFCCHMRFILRSVKFGNCGKSMISCFNVIKILFYIQSHGSDGSHTGYYYSSHQIAIPPSTLIICPVIYAAFSDAR